VKEFVAAFADEQNNVDLSSAGESVCSGDVLTNIIGKAIAAVDGRVWRNPTLSRFLDDSYDEPSHIKGFRVTCLEQKVEDLSQRLQSVEQLSATLLETLTTVMRQNQQGRSSVSMLPINVHPRASNADSSDDETSSKLSESATSVGIPASSRRPTLDSRQMSGKSFLDTIDSARNISENTASRDGYDKMSEYDSTAILSGSPLSAVVGADGITKVDVEGNLFDGSTPGVSPRREDPAALAAARVKEVTLVDNLHFPVVADNDTDVVVRMISPHDQQVQFRESAIVMLQQQIRLVLGAVSFDTTTTKSRCFLPSDPISVTVILCQGQVAYWHSSLADRLRSIAEHGPDVEFVPGHNINPITVMTVQENIEEVHRSAMRCLSSVTVEHKFGNFKVTCKIGEIDVEITVNNRSLLCMVAFIDEFNAVVGRDNLFKQSVLFIRAWWQLETANYFSAPMGQFLSDEAIIFMVVAVFNLYWKEIRSPLYALYYFLRMYKDYDGKTQAITAQGIVSFWEDNSPQFNLLKSESHHLLDVDWLGKLWQLFNVHDPLNGDIPGAIGSQLPSGSKIRMQMLFNSMSKSMQRFERFSFNILHPFNHTNLVTEKLSSRRMGLLNQIFKAAFSQLQSLLTGIQREVEETASVSKELKMESFFPTLIQKYNVYWRPDVVGQNITPIDWSRNNASTVAMFARQGSILEYIDYCSFVADSVISESAVLTFCIDLLTWRGPLPTGEVGKLLSEATTIPSLSHKLRDKFGGLKKFLERYPSLFVFSNDHPFNPHVLLRKALSAENLELIDRGIFPVHLISKTARQITSKKGSIAAATANSSSKAAVASGEAPIATGASLSAAAGSVQTAGFNGAARHAVPSLVGASSSKLPSDYPNPHQKPFNSYPPVASADRGGSYGGAGVGAAYGGNPYGGSGREFANERLLGGQQPPAYRGGPAAFGFGAEYMRGAGAGGHFGGRGGHPSSGMSLERERDRYAQYRGEEYYPQDLSFEAMYARGGGAGRGSNEAAMFPGYDRRLSRGELGGRSSAGFDEYDIGGMSGHSSSLFGGSTNANAGAGAIGSNRPVQRGGSVGDLFGFDSSGTEPGYQPFGGNSQFY
jgi:hypothetical protein